MTDPELVADAIYAVQRAMEGWQRAALAAVSACRKEQEATWDTVQTSGRAAMEARIRAENQTQDLRGFQSSVEGSRCNLAAAADTVEMSTRRHQALAAHVARTRAAWSGHLERARCDHQVALQHLNAAGWAERVASERLGAAQAQVEGVRSRYRAAALAELRQAEVGYQDAAARRRQAAVWEVEQRARVERCGRALALAQQAGEVLGSGAASLGTAAQAVETGRARWSEAQQATNSAQAHLGKMAQHASEAVSHANRADEHLTTATRHLEESEDWLRQGYLLADHAAGDMSEQIKQLLRADRSMGGGGETGPEIAAEPQGPGVWTPASESMSDRAAAYQAKITGRPGWVYKVKGVKFDGYSNGALQEAKGPGYASFVKGGKFQRWFHGQADLVEQARRQEGAAGGTPITWSVAEEPAVDAIDNLFDQANIVGIDVMHLPAEES